MGFWSKLFRREEARGVTLSDPGWVLDAWGPKAASGISVTPDSAMRAIAVFACVRLLAETVSTLPLHLMRRTGSGGKEQAKDHPLYSILHDGPNPLMTATQAGDAMMASLLLRGNAYALVVRGYAGEILEHIPLHPDRVRVESSKSGRELVYIVDGKDRILSGSMWHIRGFSIDGVMGVSPITYAREAVGLALAAERHGAAV
ncbi:MAG TPA: phage portal protein, partial [Vulgatibacter sp.]